MKVAGIVLAALGGLMLLSGIKLAVMDYDLHDFHDLSKFLGGLAASSLIVVSGTMLIRKSKHQD
jgi:hypothetical protein